MVEETKNEEEEDMSEDAYENLINAKSKKAKEKKAKKGKKK